MQPNRADMRGESWIKKRARELRRNMTDAEQVLWKALRKYRLGWRFRRQFPIAPYIVDFACVEAHLMVEADGGQHTRPGEHEKRDAELQRQGWRVLRFWNNEILANPEGVMRTLAETLGAAARETPPPQPSPACGGGSFRRNPAPTAGDPMSGIGSGRRFRHGQVDRLSE